MYQTYELFDLRIFRGHEGVYPVEVLRSPAGEAAGEFTLPFSQTELRTILEQLETGQVDRDFLQTVGRQLYQMLFVPPIQRRYSESLAGLGDAEGLRLRLRIDPPELTSLPWEFLFDPQTNEFLALSPRVPLVRYVAAGTVEPLQVEAPVRLLLVVSNPSDAPPLDTGKEVALVQEALAPQVASGHYVVDLLEHPTLHQLADSLREGYHILHYVGHAYLDPNDGQGYLVLEDEEGASLPVDADALSPMLKDTSLRLMVLNACESGRSPGGKVQIGGRDAQMGLAPSLVAGGMSAVVAMQFPVPDQSAILLAREFYSALADNVPVDAALSEARKVIHAELGADCLDWGIPVLFMRAPDGHILEVKPPPRPKGEALFSTRGWIAVGAVVAVLLALLGALAFSGLLTAGVVALPTPTPTLVASPAEANEFLVLVADFYPKTDDIRVEVPARLEPQIQAALEANQVPNARVLGVPDRPASPQDAIALAQRYNASIVVWGWYDTYGLEARVEVLDSPWLESIGKGRPLLTKPSQTLNEVDIYGVAPETLRASIRKELGSQINYLVLYTVGRIHYWQAVNLREAGDPAFKDEYRAALQLFDRAIAELEGIGSVDPAMLGAEALFYSRGAAYLRLREWDRAAEAFRRAIEIKPDYPQAHYNLAYVYQWGRDGTEEDLNAALEQYRLAAETDTTSDRWVAAEAYYNMGWLQENMLGDYRQAEANYRQVLEIDPDHLSTLWSLGWLDYSQLGNYEEAIALTRRAIELNPEDRSPDTELYLSCNLGLYYLAVSNPISATAVYDSVIPQAAARPPASAADILATCREDLNGLLEKRADLSDVASPILDKISATESSLPAQEGSP